MDNITISRNWEGLEKDILAWYEYFNFIETDWDHHNYEKVLLLVFNLLF